MITEKKRKYNKEYVSKNRDKLNLYQREYRQKNLEKVRGYSKKYYAQNKNKKKEYQSKRFNQIKEARLRRNFNLTLNEFNKMLKNQNNKCVICNSNFTIVKKPCVDHDHETNQVRELLCQKCNTVVGFVYEDLNIVNNLYNYIKKHKFIKTSKKWHENRI